MKRYLLLLLVTLLLATLVVNAATEPRVIRLPEKPTDVQTFAASELQKYIYQRTHRLLPIRTGSSASTPALRLATDTTLGTETYDISRSGNCLTICGGSDIALLYGSYAYAEYLGVRFALHGDILPDTPFDRSLLDCPTGRHTPLFAIRGLLPFHDFPEGPDLWDEDMYKACLSQMVKMKMNFFSLHTYPHVEPNVWIGQPGDVRADGTVTHSYPTTLANTARAGAWGYSAMDTRTYSSGAATLFADSVYQSPLLDGASPWPRTPEQMNLIFDRTGQLFHNAFSLGRDLGIRFCVGVETPLSVPKEVADRLREQGRDPYAPETIADLYRGIFTRITRTHPIDYFWLWTPEEWTWGTPSDASIRNTIADVRIAREVLSNEFDSLGFGLSGWVLGPPDNRCLFDTILPSGDFLASLSRLCGQERLDLGYAQLPAQRKRVPVLWLEDDPALTTPQFWVGRLRSDLAECHGIGCHGVIANFWRTGSIAPNLMAYAQACWEQQEWNPDFDKPYTPAPETKSDLRLGGVGTNYYHYIRGTEDQYLFNTQRYDLEGYRINLPNGTYRITFLFSETRYKSAGERIFDISIEGEPLLTDIDVFARAGSDSAYALTTPEFRVDDYTLDIRMIPRVGPTFLSAFVIEGQTDDVNQVKGEPYKRSIDVGGGLYKEFEADLNEFQTNTPAKPRDLPSESFYADYARAMFGAEVAPRVASIFASLDGTRGNDGFRDFRMPRPATWITGPGVINPNETDWAEESARYAFVDTLIQLRDTVHGTGNLERYDYWLNTFRALRTMGHLGCQRGLLDRQMKQLAALPTDQRAAFAREKILPERVALARLWEEMIRYLLPTVSNTGELGTIINLESQTRGTYSFVTRHDAQIEAALGTTLPVEAQLSTAYTGSPRMFVLNERSTLSRGESYTLRVNLLGSDRLTRAPVLKYRALGEKRYRQLPLKRQTDRTYEVTAPEFDDQTIEYYIEAEFDGEPITYPATAPELNRTWSRF